MSVNYQRELDRLLIGLSAEDYVPSLMLHSCCAACSSYVLEYLSDFFKITVFYYNPNIFPAEEYEKRLDDQIKLISRLKTKNSVSFIAGSYIPDVFFNQSRGLEHEKEGGERCFRCYTLRLEETAKYAKENSFDYFTTTLSISPYKNAEKLNEIGKELSQKYGVSYLSSDFKKKNGYKRSIELSKEYELYRQDYCGCVYSKAWAEKMRNGEAK
ncbi:MAG: epoxyqueuosine reductase QueH [Oscillospiraceae bacterium]|jgi:hypothetical protein